MSSLFFCFFLFSGRTGDIISLFNFYPIRVLFESMSSFFPQQTVTGKSDIGHIVISLVLLSCDFDLH